MNRKFTKKEINQIISLYNKKERLRNIASQFYSSVPTIIFYLKQNGIRIRNIGEAIQIKFSLKEEHQIVEFYTKQKFSLEKIAKIFQVCPRTIYKILKKYKIKIWNGRTFTLNQNFFSHIDSYQKAYILGLIISDGNIHYKSNSLLIALKEEDGYLLQKIYKLMSSNKLVKFKKDKKGYERAIFNVHSKQIAKDLRKYFIVPNKTFRTQFPLNIPIRFYKSVLLGILDGDGSVYIYRDKRYINQLEWKVKIIGTVILCKELQNILLKKNIKSCISTIKQYKNNPLKPLCNLSIQGNRQVFKLLYWLYDKQTIFLKRKYKKFNELKSYLLTKQGGKKFLKKYAI